MQLLYYYIVIRSLLLPVSLILKTEIFAFVPVDHVLMKISFPLFPHSRMYRKFAQYRTNDGWNISFGRHAEFENAIEFGKFGHA